MKTKIVIPDPHFPFHHKKKLNKAKRLIGKIKPDQIIQIGDLYDLFSASKYPGPRLFTLEDEVYKSRNLAEKFWEDVKSESPDSVCYQMMGNHDIRPRKRVLEKVPELLPYFNFDDLWAFEGVKTIHDYREELILDGIVFHHFFKTKLGDTVRTYLKNCAGGHTHRPGIFFMPLDGKIIWEMNCGYLADNSAPGLRYTQTKWTNWSHAIGLIDSLGPRVIPL